MKTIKKLALGLLLLSSLGSLYSCGSSDSSTPTPAITQLPGSKGTLTATVAGQSFAANYSTATKFSNSSSIRIVGTNSDGTATGARKRFNLDLPNNQTGTYQIGTSSYYEDDKAFGVSGGGVYYPTTGSITISELTATKIKGTFNFSGLSRGNSGDRTIAITNGAFDINF